MNTELEQTSCSSLDLKIADIELKIKSATKQAYYLLREKRKRAAVEFIAANRITKDDVELSSRYNCQSFRDVGEFGRWLKEHSNKRFAEWNTIIYFQSDLKAGRLPIDSMPATMEDLPG